jgi:hypothetical protein
MTLSTLFHWCSFTTRRPLVTQVEKGFRSGRQNMVSPSKKRFQLCFVRNSLRWTNEQLAPRYSFILFDQIVIAVTDSLSVSP